LRAWNALQSTRNRLIAFIAVVAVCVVGSILVVRGGGATGTDRIVQLPQTPKEVTINARALGSGSIVVFRDLGEEPDGGRYQTAYVALGDPQGPRHLLGLRCGRVFFSAGRGTCLGYATRPIPGYRVDIFNRQMKVQHSIGLPGVPSRTRISGDGKYASTTVFTSGHSYATAGTFSTATKIYDVATGKAMPNLEQWHDYMNGHLVTAVDRNYWGVTFAADSNTFYATLGEGAKTWLVKGDIRTRTMRTIHTNVACPSLSPDGTRIAFKKAISAPAYAGAPVRWRFTVLDLRTGRETSLAERRSIDDQIEWLDNSHVLYGDGHDVWVANADGTGQPRIFIANADSPAVVSPPATS
jgi:hypothetical protein